MQAEELKRIRDMLKKSNLKLTIVFEKINYSITLNGDIKVEDKTSGIKIKWFQAFGNRTLADVFNSLKIETFILTSKNKEFTFNKLGDVIRFIENYQ